MRYVEAAAALTAVPAIAVAVGIVVKAAASFASAICVVIASPLLARSLSGTGKRVGKTCRTHSSDVIRKEGQHLQAPVFS